MNRCVGVHLHQTQINTGQLRPACGAWEKSDPWHFYCPGWKERLHSSNYIWRGRGKHCQRLSGLPNRVCARVGACICMCVQPPPPFPRTCISQCLITSLTPMDESRQSFSSQKVTKHTASTRLWLLSCWLCHWNELIFNNSSVDTWFGTFLLVG